MVGIKLRSILFVDQIYFIVWVEMLSMYITHSIFLSNNSLSIKRKGLSYFFLNNVYTLLNNFFATMITLPSFEEEIIRNKFLNQFPPEYLLSLSQNVDSIGSLF